MCQPTAKPKKNFAHAIINRDDSLRYPSQPSESCLTASSILHPTHVPYRLAASYILSTLKEYDVPPPTIGIICGSGLSGLSKALDVNSTVTIPYGDVPGFPDVTVAGHAGEMVVGMLHGISIICFRGRFHSYEGHDMNTVALPVRTMRCLGVQLVIVTNAAGGLKDSYKVGDVAVIRDHIALPLLCGKNPLVGMNDEELGPRFPPTSNLYDAKLQDIVMGAAKEVKLEQFMHKDGTYAFVSGPNYESKSECNMLKMLGADAVGMSTVPEILAAHHAGMAVLCLSLITNKVVLYDDPSGKVEHANHEEVLAAVAGRGAQLVELVKEVVNKVGKEYLCDKPALSPICLEIESRVMTETAEVSGERKDEGLSLCPFHIAKRMLRGDPKHLVLGAAVAVFGAVVAMKRRA
jgi:purine-nucleoside phosphorylase